MSAVIVDTARLSLAHELLELSDRFMIESTMWRDRECANQLARDARLLATIGRATIDGQSDIDRARAYADVAAVAIGNVQGARRFFGAILTPPECEGLVT